MLLEKFIRYKMKILCLIYIAWLFKKLWLIKYIYRWSHSWRYFLFLISHTKEQTPHLCRVRHLQPPGKSLNVCTIYSRRTAYILKYFIISACFFLATYTWYLGSWTREILFFLGLGDRKTIVFTQWLLNKIIDVKTLTSRTMGMKFCQNGQAHPLFQVSRWTLRIYISSPFPQYQQTLLIE